MHLTLIQNQNLTLQQKTSLELDQGIEDIFEITQQYNTDRTNTNFLKEIQRYFIKANNALEKPYARRIIKFIEEFEWYLEALKEQRKKGTPY